MTAANAAAVPSRCSRGSTTVDQRGATGWSGRDLVAALAPTSGKDGATRAGPHAEAEAVDLGPAAVVRLKGALAHGDLSRFRTTELLSCRSATTAPTNVFFDLRTASARYCNQPVDSCKRHAAAQHRTVLPARVETGPLEGQLVVPRDPATRRAKYRIKHASCGNGRCVVSVPRPDPKKPGLRPPSNARGNRAPSRLHLGS